MANMFFNMTTKLYIEKDAVSNHKKDIEGFGKKALIVTGHNSSRINGSLSDVENTLQSIGTEYIVYNKTDEIHLLKTFLTQENLPCHLTRNM